MGCTAKRLPIFFPLMVICSSGSAKGEEGPLCKASSQGKSSPSEAAYLRKFSGVFNVGRRTHSWLASGIRARILSWQRHPVKMYQLTQILRRANFKSVGRRCCAARSIFAAGWTKFDGEGETWAKQQLPSP
jgi:hypothetical protein